MTKPTVFYKPDKWDEIFLGYSGAIICHPLNHPTCSNHVPIRTSPVIKVGVHGGFETENSIYIPFKGDEKRGEVG